jgi:hypothetical protein
MPKDQILALKTVKVSLSDDEQGRLRLEAARRGFSTLKAYMRHAILHFDANDSRAKPNDLGQLAMILYDLRSLATEKSTPITRSQVRRLVDDWEKLCHGFLAEAER